MAKVKVGTLRPAWKAASSSGGGGGGGGSDVEPTADRGSRSPLHSAELATIPSGVVGHVFTFSNLTGTTSLLQGTRAAGTISVQMPYSGSVVGLSMYSTETKVTGSAIFYTFIEDTQTSGTLEWTTGIYRDVQVWSEGSYPFAAFEDVDVRVTTSSFTPTTADVETILYVTYSSI